MKNHMLLAFLTLSLISLQSQAMQVRVSCLSEINRILIDAEMAVSNGDLVGSVSVDSGFEVVTSDAQGTYQVTPKGGFCRDSDVKRVSVRTTSAEGAQVSIESLKVADGSLCPVKSFDMIKLNGELIKATCEITESN